jgi:hypothetical protein
VADVVPADVVSPDDQDVGFSIRHVNTSIGLGGHVGATLRGRPCCVSTTD